MPKDHNMAADQICKKVTDYCKKQLNQEYEDIYKKVFQDLLKIDMDIFNRGKADIWAAAVVWAVGSINFLGDKSFEPYTTLADVCQYFNANTSTVGQKASKIRELLDMNYLNSDYLIESPAGKFLDSLVMIPDGFIVPSYMFEDEFNEDGDEELVDDTPMEYLIVLSSSKSVDSITMCQLEYLIKKTLSKESKFLKIEKHNPKTVLITFFGTKVDIETLDDKLKSSYFKIVNIYHEDSENFEY
jgi:hypothetical protein